MSEQATGIVVWASLFVTAVCPLVMVIALHLKLKDLYAAIDAARVHEVWVKRYMEELIRRLDLQVPSDEGEEGDDGQVGTEELVRVRKPESSW